MGAGYRLCLVPVDDGEGSPASSQEGATPVHGVTVHGVKVPVLLHVLISELKPSVAAATDVHRRVLERMIAESGRARGEIRGEIGWGEVRLLRLLDRLGPMEYEDLFTVLETLGVTRQDYFEDVCRELAELEGA